MSQTPHSENGLEKNSSEQKPPKEDIGDIGSKTNPNSQTHHKMNNYQTISSTQESVLKNNQEISTNNQYSSNQNSQTTHSSQTLEAELITIAKDLKPYWNNSSKEISKKLWLPIKIGSQDSASTSSNGCSLSSDLYWKQWRNLMIKNQTTSQQTSWKYSLSLLQDITEKENTIVTRKVKIHPNPKQVSLFRQCVGTHRFFYNKAIGEINRRYNRRMNEFINYPTCLHCNDPKENGTFNCKKHKKKAIPWNLEINLPSIRKSIMKSDVDLNDEEIWQKDIPFDTRQLAIKDAVNSYKTATALKIKGIIHQFELKFKKKQTPKQSFWINKKAICDEWRIFPRRLKNESPLVFNNRHKLRFLKNKKVENDLQIMNDRGCWYMLFTYERKYEEFETPEFENISLDPGVRTFQTGYSSEGITLKVGERQIDDIKKLHNKIDNFKSLRGKVEKRTTRKHIKYRLLNLQKKVSDVVDNLHNQSACMLTNKFENIILPPFETSKMLQEDKMYSSTKRMMGSLSFYRFKKKLEAQCQRKLRNLYIQSEACTTKTCGSCGKRNDVGYAHVYECGWDIHGARNIFIRYQTKRCG